MPLQEVKGSRHPEPEPEGAPVCRRHGGCQHGLLLSSGRLFLSKKGACERFLSKGGGACDGGFKATASLGRQRVAYATAVPVRRRRTRMVEFVRQRRIIVPWQAAGRVGMPCDFGGSQAR